MGSIIYILWLYERKIDENVRWLLLCIVPIHAGYDVLTARVDG